MSAPSKSKLRLLLLREILLEETDEKNPLPLVDIQERLLDAEITSERKGLYNDIQALRQMGDDVRHKNDPRNEGWFVGKRPFQLAELKMLVDILQASPFLSPKKSRELIKKVMALGSVHQAEELRRQVFIQGRVKTMNESIFWNVDQIQRALREDRPLSFRYFRYNARKEKELRREGAQYLVSPKALLWDRENYYLAAYDHDMAELRHFRVDKMQEVRVEKPPTKGEPVADFDPVGYGKRHFGMFRGVETAVKLRCPAELSGVLVDRFGQEVNLSPVGEDGVLAQAEVAISPQFWGWLFGLGPGVKLLAPQWAAAEYEKRLHEALASQSAEG